MPTFAFGLSPLELLCPLFFAAVALGGGLAWLFALVDCLKNEPQAGNDRVVWLAVIVVLNLLGAALYLLIRRPARVRDLGR